MYGGVTPERFGIALLLLFVAVVITAIGALLSDLICGGPDPHPNTTQEQPPSDPAIVLCIEGKSRDYCVPIKAFWRDGRKEGGERDGEDAR